MAATKLKQIEDINNEVIENAIKENSRQYSKFIDSILLKAIRSADGKRVTRRQIKEAIKNFKVPQRAISKQVYIMLLLSDITSRLERTQKDKKILEETSAAFIILTLFPPNKPKLVAKKVNKLVEAFIKNDTSKLNTRDKLAFKQVDKLFKQNRKFIIDSKKELKEQFERVEKQIKSNVSKVIVKNMNKEIRTKVREVVTKNGIEKLVIRPQTIPEVRGKLNEKFGKQVNYRVRRIIDTEMHDLAEKVKLFRHASMGFTHKRWNTERDKRVRHTHALLEGKVIPIKSEFKVGASKGQYPSAPKLTPEERINCRCTLTYLIK